MGLAKEGAAPAGPGRGGPPPGGDATLGSTHIEVYGEVKFEVTRRRS